MVQVKDMMKIVFMSYCFFIDLHLTPYSYTPFTRKLDKLKSFGNNNTIYIKDYNFASQRLVEAKTITINNCKF